MFERKEKQGGGCEENISKATQDKSLLIQASLLHGNFQGLCCHRPCAKYNAKILREDLQRTVTQEITQW